MMSQQQKQLFARALDRVAGDESTLQMLAGITVEDAPELLSQLESEAAAGRCADAARTAPALKGLFSTFETDQPVSVMLSLIDAGRNGDIELMKTTMDDLEPKLATLFKEIQGISESTA
mgnify:CR=1 FL=1